MSDSCKKGAHTSVGQTGGTKQVRAEFLRTGQAADIFKAPPSRLFTRDYCKVKDYDDKGNQDTVGPFVGNPLLW